MELLELGIPLGHVGEPFGEEGSEEVGVEGGDEVVVVRLGEWEVP